MKKLIVLIIALAAFILVLVGGVILYEKLSDRVTPQFDFTEQSGEVSSSDTDPDAPSEYAAPDFTVYDGEGNAVKLSDFAGKPVVLNFWASWCPPCQSEMPDFEAMYKQYGDQVEFMMVNCTDGSRETVETAKAFIAERYYSFPVYFDSDLDASTKYGAYSIPMTYFINAKGDLVVHAKGAISGDQLGRGISMILE